MPPDSTNTNSTSATVLKTVEGVAGFIAGFFPGAAPIVTIAEEVLPTVAPAVIALYDALFASKPATVTDEEWLATLKAPVMTETVDTVAPVPKPLAQPAD